MVHWNNLPPATRRRRGEGRGGELNISISPSPTSVMIINGVVMVCIYLQRGIRLWERHWHLAWKRYLMKWVWWVRRSNADLHKTIYAPRRQKARQNVIHVHDNKKLHVSSTAWIKDMRYLLFLICIHRALPWIHILHIIISHHAWDLALSISLAFPTFELLYCLIVCCTPTQTVRIDGGRWNEDIHAVCVAGGVGECLVYCWFWRAQLGGRFQLFGANLKMQEFKIWRVTGSQRRSS